MRQITLALLGSLALAGAAQSAAVKVMVVYDSAAIVQSSIIDPAGYAAGQINRANALLANSQITHRYALAYAHPTAITPPSSSPSAVLDWLTTDPTMKSLRTQYEADLVVAIAGNYSDSTCGQAAGTALPNILRSETRFAVVTKFSCIDSLTSNTLGHELSHLSGAAHENVPNAARPYAHPWIDTANQLGTVMMSADVACGANCQMAYQLSSPDLKFPNTTITAGNSATAHYNNIVSVVRRAFEHGYRDHPQRHNPARGLKTLRIRRKDRPPVDPFSIDEAETLSPRFIRIGVRCRATTMSSGSSPGCALPSRSRCSCPTAIW